MGYCPQFDGLIELMTGRELLSMYARLRGVPESRVRETVEDLITGLMLEKHADKRCGKYSGGNKRKLSVAIALIGNADLVFLDEPTAGMDPRARRFLWDLVTGVVRAGRCVVLTSHAMDECQALCSRLGIMVNGQLQCLGSPQHLKARFGDGYTLVAKVSGGGGIGSGARDLPPLSALFSTMEKLSGTCNVEDYSISQTSLEQIFCNFAEKQRDEDAAEPVEELVGRLASISSTATSCANEEYLEVGPSGGSKMQASRGPVGPTFANPLYEPGEFEAGEDVGTEANDGYVDISSTSKTAADTSAANETFADFSETGYLEIGSTMTQSSGDVNTDSIGSSDNGGSGRVSFGANAAIAARSNNPFKPAMENS
eukprot:UC1_evm1s230